MRARKLTVLATAPLLLAAAIGTAHADIVQDTIGDTSSGLTLTAGSATTGSAALFVTNNDNQSDTVNGCNIGRGEELVLDIVTPSGVTASPNPVSITKCNENFTVSFTASDSAQSGTVSATVRSAPDGVFANQVSIPVTVTQPAPTNTRPSVSLADVIAGASYEIGSAPTPTCDVTDAEDGPSAHAAQITGTLSHGLGQLTATCDYTDQGGLAADTVTATYTIVDTGDPTISYALDPATGPNGAGWYKTDVGVDFICEDSGSGIQSCAGDTTLGEGAGQSATGTAEDWAGNTATVTASGINVDKTAPTVELLGGADYYYGDAPVPPTCEADDALSGLEGTCNLEGTVDGRTHMWTATATDQAGNEATDTVSFKILPWTVRGFHSPVDMNGVWNTVKGGSTVPLKFEAFAAQELTNVSAVKSFSQSTVACDGSQVLDEIEIVSTGGTALRYDTTGGQFIQNWQTPKKPGACYVATVTLQDGTSISANFKLK